MTRVMSVTSGRADVGILASVWHALAARDGVDLEIFVTGMHCRHGAACELPLPHGATVHAGGADLAGTRSGAASAMARILDDAARAFERAAPDIVLVVGDRLDMMPAAMATLAGNIPLAHVHGGELTLGAVDDRIRHAVTKMAHLHMVSCHSAADRVVQMGEEPWRVHVTGAPGLDTLRAQPSMTAAAVAAALGLVNIDGLRVVTVHPETNAPNPSAPLQAVLGALAAQPAPTVITAPNTDPGSTAMAAPIAAFVAAHPWAQFHDTLGTRLYANVLRQASMMVGNSSSGLIEAPLVGLPVVNVGGRQDGRERAPTVIDCAPTAAAVTTAMTRAAALAPPTDPASPYGDGQAAERIADILADLPSRESLLYKPFYATGTDQANVAVRARA